MADARLQGSQEPVSDGHLGSKDDHDIGRKHDARPDTYQGECHSRGCEICAHGRSRLQSATMVDRQEVRGQLLPRWWWRPLTTAGMALGLVAVWAVLVPLRRLRF